MDDDNADFPARPAASSRRSALLGLAAIGCVGTTTIGGFLYAGGWLTSQTLTPSRFTDRFEQVYGQHQGFRRNHAKGVSVSGYFVGNGAGTTVSKAVVFKPDRVPVLGRFSLSGGVPTAADTNSAVRGFGLLFNLSNGEQWRTAMVNLPVFLDNTPQGFYDRLVAAKPLPDTGKPDSRKMADFLAKHPETAKAMEIVKKYPPTSGFDNSTFNGLNTFDFTNDGGVTVPVRWSLVPVQPVEPGTTVPPPDKDYLFDSVIDMLSKNPLQWRLILTIGGPNDPTSDATVPWPDSREKIDVGTLTIDSAATEDAGNARDVNFDPLVLPDGISASDDPLVSARSAVYAQSFTRRSREPKQPSEVTVSKVQR
jgi:catalase